MALAEKLSIHKLMTPQGEWPGLDEGEQFFEDADATKTGALITDSAGWPRAAIQPPLFRPETDYPIDKKSVLINGFSPESAVQHKVIKTVSALTTGSEVEVSMISKTRRQNRTTENMLGRVSELGQEQGIGGYATFEIRDDMIEANRPVTNATFDEVMKTARQQNRILVQLADEQNSRVTFDSSASILDHNVDFPASPYVRAIVDLLADKFLTEDKRVLSWTALVSEDILGENTEAPLTHTEIAQNIDNHDFAIKMAREFCCKAHHIHIGLDNPNPNFYAFALNHIMGGIGLPRSIGSFSGPFKNGRYFKIHEVKQMQRPIFKTAGFQPPYEAMGSKHSNQIIQENLSVHETASLTRALIPENKAHGNSRIRTEGTLKTAELLFPSTHPLAEVEAAQVMAYAYDMAILSHYYSGMGITGEIPENAKRFYAEPDRNRFHRNRIQAAVNGPYATVYDGTGEAMSYFDYMQTYTDFLKKELPRLNIETPEGEIEKVCRWLLKSAQKPTEWKIENYLNPMHPDYGVGCFATHMVGELSARLNGERARTLGWPMLRNSVKTGKYEHEVKSIIDEFGDLIHSLYTPAKVTEQIVYNSRV